MKLLTLGEASPKIIKSDKAGKGYLSAIMYLAPHKLSGQNICPQASPGCIAACLNTSGRGRMNSVQTARLNRTKYLFDYREKFIEQLTKEIDSFARKTQKLGQRPAIRLNGTSDLNWVKLAPSLFNNFPNVQFYDYTKVVKRYKEWLDGNFPVNYHLTFSRSELNHQQSLEFLEDGGTVAVVFQTADFPEKWNRYRTFNADENDLRFLDYSGVQALFAKGKAKSDETGFVIKL